jgi:hypothetical protein
MIIISMETSNLMKAEVASRRDAKISSGKS